MAHVNPYLNFDGNCREAMLFYKECLGGELQLMTVEDSPAANEMPGLVKDQIMHSQLEKDGKIIIMASDMIRGKALDGNTINIMLNCTSEEEINNFYNKLSAGGEILDELKEQFWGDIFGMVKDKFGKSWMFNFNKNQHNQN